MSSLFDTFIINKSIGYKKECMRSILLGHLIGDSLGAQYELKGNISNPIVNGFMYRPKRYIRYQGYKSGALGQWTDDTEMSICLLSTLIDNSFNYIKKDTVESYIRWANSKNFGMGTNTSKHFKGISKYESYTKRISQDNFDRTSQSNGTIMRAYPLLFANNYDNSLKLDTDLTNPNIINIEVTSIYLHTIMEILNKKPIRKPFSNITIIQNWIDLAFSEPIIDNSNGINNLKEFEFTKLIKRNTTNITGWCVVALCFALYTRRCLESCDVKTLYLNIIAQKVDPDTTGAISGAIIGAYHLKNIETQCKDWIDIILKCDTFSSDYPREICYNPNTILETIKQI